MIMKKLILFAGLLSLLLSCSKLEYTVYDQPFVYFDEAAVVNVDAGGKVLRTYNLRLSAGTQTEAVTIQISSSVGDGLKEGVDFTIESSPTVTFAPGIYRMPFRIQWLRNDIDLTKDNSLVLKIESCDRSDVVLGIPGPAGYGRSVKFIKFK